jgi:nucleoside-diphosphate-sugar epimerase
MLRGVAGTDKLVLGASGFLGSHVTRQLVERGETVRVMLRQTSSTRGIDDLPVNPTTVRLMSIMAPMDHGKAVRELGWQPRDVHESIREAAEFFDRRRRDRSGFARDR